MKEAVAAEKNLCVTVGTYLFSSVPALSLRCRSVRKRSFKLFVNVHCAVPAAVLFWPWQDTRGQRESVAAPGAHAEEALGVHESLD